MPDDDGYWSMTAQGRYTRRAVLRAAGAGAITAAALAGGLGCGTRTAKPRGTGGQNSVGVASAPPKLEQGKYGGKLVYVTANNAPDLDPRLTQSIGLFGFLSSISNRVVRTAEGGEAKDFYDFTIKPDLAASWEQPADLTSITFKLNPGVRWHDKPPVDGRELTSADLKYTFESYAKSGAHTASFDALERVETPDPYTAKFVLNQPFGGFVEVMTVPTQVVFAHEVIEKYGDLKSVTIGTGPFMLEKFDREVGVSAVKNPNYFKKGLPYLDGFETPFVTDAATRKASFRAGRADLIQLSDLSELKELQSSSPNLVSQEQVASGGGFFLAMEQDKPPYNDVRVRRALSMAIDRGAQQKGLYQGHATYGWGIPWFYWLDAPPTVDQLGPYWKYNPAEAKKLMAAAGYQDGFKDTLTYFEYWAAMTSQVQLVQAQLKQNLNVDLKINQIDYPTYFQQYTSHKWTGTYWGFQLASLSTVDDFTHQVVRSDSVANYSYMKDDQIDKLSDEIRREGDLGKRKTLVRQMVEREHDQAYRLWMPVRNAFDVTQPHVRGFYGLALRGGGCQDYGGAARELHWIDKA